MHRWSIVVLESPESGPLSRIPRRIVGLPGETIELVGGQIQVDGQPVTPAPGMPVCIDRSYFGRYDGSLRGKPGAGCEGNPIHLGPDEYYVLGDSSVTAIDSRLWETPAEGHQLGALPRDHIIGRVTAVYWPPNRWRLFRE
jgi:signal peptidase I